jgi:hypothetical protein
MIGRRSRFWLQEVGADYKAVAMARGRLNAPSYQAASAEVVKLRQDRRLYSLNIWLWFEPSYR